MFGTFAKAIACIALGQAPTQAPSDVLYYNSRAQRMEASFPEARRGDIRELLLYASQDQGESWSQVSRITPEQRHFEFIAPIDGTYWLRVAVVNRDNKQEPANLYKVQPNWKLVIDTLKPLAKITSATRSGAEVAVAWEIQENNPDWAGFKVEYLNTPGGSGTPIANASPGFNGTARFTPNTNGAVIVRLTMRDKAGNETIVQQDVAGREGVAANASPAPNPLAGLPTTPQIDTSNALAPLPTLPGTQAPTLPDAPRENFGSTVPGNPELKYPPTPPKTLAPPAPPTPLVPLERAGTRWAGNGPAQLPPPTAEQLVSIAHSKDGVVQAQYQMPAPPAARPGRPLPALQYINSPEAVLNYELSKVGPSGVGSVDIYLTQDDGQTWEHVATDPAVIGKTTGGRHQGIVVLPGDSIYGFSLVVKSQAQLKQEMASPEKKGRGPRAGDAPEIRVEVDTLPPTAELFQPRRDPSKANSLMLIWSASDKNLGSNPITLEWAERREGPWFPIAANVANSGKHSWQLPEGLPVQVYMRLRAKDLAGNEGVAVTPDPQLVDLSEPEGRLVNVTTPPRR